MPLSRRSIVLIAGIVLFVLGLDQASKALMLAYFQPGEVAPVIPGLFNLTLHFNPGVAFGMFAGLEDTTRMIVLSVTTVIALGFVGYFLCTDYRDDGVGQCALAMVLGGALGNICDRLRIGQVVDFFDFYIGTAHWPTFNVADSFISIGVCVLIARGFWQMRVSAPKEATPHEQ